MQSDQYLHCPLTESLDITELMNGGQRSRWYFVHVQDDLNLHVMRMFQNTFLFDMAHLGMSRQLSQIPSKLLQNTVKYYH